MFAIFGNKPFSTICCRREESNERFNKRRRARLLSSSLSQAINGTNFNITPCFS